MIRVCTQFSSARSPRFGQSTSAFSEFRTRKRKPPGRHKSLHVAQIPPPTTNSTEFRRRNLPSTTQMLLLRPEVGRKGQEKAAAVTHGVTSNYERQRMQPRGKKGEEKTPQSNSGAQSGPRSRDKKKFVERATDRASIMAGKKS